MEGGVASSQLDGQDGARPVHGSRHDDDGVGYFVDEKGERVPDVLRFQVVDTEMVPAHEADKFSLQIDATLLDEEAEKTLLQEEQAKSERQRGGRSRTPGGDAVMSGGLQNGRQGSVASTVP